jgi:5'-nucleotidase
MLERTNTDFSFLRYGDFNTNLYQGEITHLDLVALCPFARTLVVLEVTGDILRRVVEANISGIRSGIAIGGGKVEFDPVRPSNNRLTFLQIGEHPIYPQKEYRIVTIDYLANGFSGFEILSEVDSSRTYQTGIMLRDAVHEYIKQHTPLDQRSVRLDERWTKN